MVVGDVMMLVTGYAGCCAAGSYCTGGRCWTWTFVGLIGYILTAVTSNGSWPDYRGEKLA